MVGKLNARKPQYLSKVEGEARRKLADWLWADFMLYDYFLSR